MAGLKLVNVCKEYEGTKTRKKKSSESAVRYAVSNFNLEIEDKEFVVFVGPSGCGKSTTLRMIAGLEEITSGELYIDGVLMNDVEPKDRDIAMVFQNYALYPQMSVFDNIAFSLKLRKIPVRVEKRDKNGNVKTVVRYKKMSKSEIKEKVTEVAKILDIEEFLDRKPKALSGGQRQRVALGRAMVRNPKVFLLDEPLSNLDAKLRLAMRTEITKLHKKIGTTFIYVTHDQMEAMTMGSKIVVMKDGLIQQVGAPQYLYDHPANKFVAGFIGSPPMNFFDCSLDGKKLTFLSRVAAFNAVSDASTSTEASAAVSEDAASVASSALARDEPSDGTSRSVADRAVLDAGDKVRIGAVIGVSVGDLTLPDDVLSDFPESADARDVCVGVRSEDIHITGDGDDNAFECHVQMIEETGSETMMYATFGSIDEDGVVNDEKEGMFIVKIPVKSPIRAGDTVSVSFNASSLQMFDPKTENTMFLSRRRDIVCDGEKTENLFS